jgi:hypothetical protein
MTSAAGPWLFLVLVLPFIGVFAYVVVRGSAMHERLGRRPA